MLENSLKHMYYRDTFLHQSQLWTKVLENNAKLETWKKNVSSFLGLQMRSAICNTMGTLSSDLVRCNHSLIKGTNVPWRNTCFQEWDNKKNETWTSSNVTEWGSSREKKSYADGHMWVTHKDLPSSQMKEMTSEVQIQKTRSRVWISGSMSTLLVFEYSTQKDGKGKLDAWISGSKSTLFGNENSTWGDGRAKLGFLIYLTESMCCKINSFSCFW